MRAWIKIRFLKVFHIALLLCTANAYGIDINSIVTKNCEMHSGILIDVNQIDVKLIDFKGQVKFVLIDEIDTIFTYGHKVNPFSQFDLDNESYQLLKDVYFDENQKQPDLSGWAIKFVEDLVFFYSLEGKVHVLSIDQIGKIRPFEGARNILPLKYQAVRLEVSDYLAKCQFQQTAGESEVLLRPVRILSDQIKIGQFLANFAQGKQNLDNFQERTYLYAKPYLYPKRNRLSVPYFKKDFGLSSPIEFAYIWSTGRDYHFQSNNGIGSQVSEHLPYLGPTFLLRSDFKSHFFSGSFEGNMLGLSAGFYPELAFSDPDSDNGSKSQAVESFNYLAIMGADYGPYSIGFGSYFPVHQITFDADNKRGVLAYKMTPLIRLIFIKRQFKLRVTAAYTKYQFSRNAISDQLSIDSFSSFGGKSSDGSSTTNSVSLDDFSDYQFTSRFIRIGGEVDVYQNIKLLADVVYSKGDYRETVAGTTNTLVFENTAMSIGVEHAFSHYVNLKLFYQRLHRNNAGKFNNLSVDNTQLLSTIGGHFELLF